MLSITAPASQSFCDGRSRRHFLKLGGLALGGGYIGEHGCHGNAPGSANFLGGLLEQIRISPVDDERHPCLGQRQGTSLTQALAGRSDNRDSVLQSKIHGVSLAGMRRLS